MADILVGYPPEAIEALRVAGPIVRGLILDNGVMLAPGGPPEPPAPDIAFEQWLIERWLRDIRSEAFRQSADFQYLQGEWERGST